MRERGREERGEERWIGRERRREGRKEKGREDKRKKYLFREEGMEINAGGLHKGRQI